MEEITINLKTKINDDLWRSIKRNYESESYSEAILDAIYYLNNLIRNKTGLKSDGTNLIGQAFGGEKPKIKVNDLQTESDWNVQKGLLLTMKGIMRAIRNPRSHDRYDDNIKDAESIIVFIDYLCRIITESKTQFSKDDYLDRVLDNNFVENKRYAELLVEEIPNGKILDISIEVYKKKEETTGSKLKLYFDVLLKKLDDEQVEKLYDVISQELRVIDSNDTIRSILQIFPMKYWNKINEISQLRIENIILKSIENGFYDNDKGLIKYHGKIYDGSLGTWIGFGNTKYISMKFNLLKILINKLESNDKQEQNYVLNYFWNDIFQLFEEVNLKDNFFRLKFEEYIKQKLKEWDVIIYNKLYSIMESDKYEDWKDTFIEEYKKFEEEYEEMDVPF